MLRAVSRVVLIVGSVALGAAGAVAWRADLLVGYGLGRALEAQKASLSSEMATSAVRLSRAEVGDEGYWLTRSSLEGQAAFDRHLAVGNRITVTGAGGQTRTLEVVEIASEAPLLRVADTDAPLRLVRITARVVGATDAGREELVRFYVEADKPKPAPLPASQVSLGGT